MKTNVLRALLLAIFAMILVVTFAEAQTNPNEAQGMTPYDSWHGGDVDSVSLTNGGLVLHIPLVSFPQRGNLDLSFFIRYGSKQWQMRTTPKGGQIWSPSPNTGVQIVSNLDWWLQGKTSSAGPSYSVNSPDGATHLLGFTTTALAVNFPLRSLDATGLMLLNSNTLVMRNGTQYTYPTATGVQTGPQGTQPTLITDTNGNQININSAGSALGWLDTLNRIIPGSVSSTSHLVQPGVASSDLSHCPSGTSSATVWNVPGYAGFNNGVRTFWFCYSTVLLAPVFNGRTVYNQNTSLMTAVVLPDSTMWTFSYDNYGDITRLGFPTGGSISYAYIQARPTCGSINETTASMQVASRTVDANDGAGGHQWTYKFTGSCTNTTNSAGQTVSSFAGTTTVTSPAGDDAVHTITTPISGADALYDTQAQYYQGSSSQNAVLKTVQAQYTGNTVVASSDTGELMATNVVPVQVTTIEGGRTKKLVYRYDPDPNDPSNPPITNGDGNPVIIGSLLQTDEYDFSNTLQRSVVNKYQWQVNPPYKTYNFVSLLASSTLEDSAQNRVAQTTYGYDDTSRLFISGVTVQHATMGSMRGNLNYVNRWLDSNNSMVTTTINVYDTGKPYQDIDPLGHTTTFTYSSDFNGGYLTKTQMPDTQMPDSGAQVVHHAVSAYYDFNTGLITSFTDENGNTHIYQYNDPLLRMTLGTHPDGGQTTFTYPDPNTITRQHLISPGVHDNLTTTIDGLGRTIRTRQEDNNASCIAMVDTAYDALGRTAAVSNPYCVTSETTYGITQSQYDALSRTVNVIKQDGSAHKAVYNDNASAASTEDCTTATDEAGRARQVCTDFAGRLSKVNEPNSAVPATSATGWIAVNGSEQSATSQPATSGSGSVTIQGSEASATIDPCYNPDLMPSPTCPRTIYDSGSVTITIGGHPDTAYYGSGSDGTSVALDLANAITNDANAVVTASASNGVVSLIARQPGAGGNYAWSISSASSDRTSNFDPNGSFYGTPGTGTLTGGQNASTVADSGTVTITINGTPYTTNYGASDTGSSIAGHLAALINAGSWAGAYVSGSTVALTSKTPGPSGDYPLSASYAWNTGQFTKPSFTTAASGSSLTGAKAAGAIDNNPYVATYQYNTRGDLVCVHQKAADTTPDKSCTDTSVPAAWRPRNFTYDSFSRLLSSSNPEAGKIIYAYDNDGDVTSRTAPAPNQTGAATVTTSYSYDNLNRLLDKYYSDGTAVVSRRYDYSGLWGAPLSNPIGRLVEITALGGTNGGEIIGYDSMGRIVQIYQGNTGGICCVPISASYNLAGELVTLEYPSGLNLKYSYDSGGRLSSVADSNNFTYGGTPTYLPAGVMQQFTAQSINYHFDYNNRLQPVEIWAKTNGATVTTLFDKQYQYNPPNTTASNNGNVYTITNVKDDSRTQTFAYDALNRLASAGDKSHWSNSYVYDPWGNLLQKNPGAPAGENLVQTGDTNNRLSGLSYDAAGNVTYDGVHHYKYDAENRIICIDPDPTTAACPSTSVSYTYDAFGRRIKKSVGSPTVNYWFGPGGEIIAESDGNSNYSDYIFFAGQRLARNINGDIRYYITDHLRSTAVFADKSGTVLDDNDFYPWGGIVPGVGSTASNNHYKFTGKERDTESNLDYFGARNYRNSVGRWMSPDWSGSQSAVPYALFENPQTLNLYSFSQNSPTARVDLDGHFDDPFGVFSDGDTTYSNIQSKDDPLVSAMLAKDQFEITLDSLTHNKLAGLLECFLDCDTFGNGGNVFSNVSTFFVASKKGGGSKKKGGGSKRKGKKDQDKKVPGMGDGGDGGDDSGSAVRPAKDVGELGRRIYSRFRDCSIDIRECGLIRMGDVIDYIGFVITDNQQMAMDCVANLDPDFCNKVLGPQ